MSCRGYGTCENPLSCSKDQVSGVPLMPEVWLGFACFCPCHRTLLAARDVKVWPLQFRRLADKNGKKHGWCCSFSGPAAAPNPSPDRPLRPPSSPDDGLPSLFQAPTKVCSVCHVTLTGHIMECATCAATTHGLCGTDLSRGFSCHLFVCIVCKADMVAPTEKCSQCKWVVHQARCPATSGALLRHACMDTASGS